MKSLLNVIWIVPTLFLFSCSESAEYLIEANGERAEALFERFYDCYDIAQNTPPIEHDGIAWEADDAITEYGESNVYQIGYESFNDLSVPLDIPFDGTRRREHADMAKLFQIDLSSHQQTHDYQMDPEYSYHKIESGESCIKAIQHFLNTKYLLINRIEIKAEPVLVDDESFMMGYVAGDVLVFDVEKTKLLGGFKVETESNDYIQVPETSDVKANLDASLDHKTYRTTVERFTELTPAITDFIFEF